jgi:hypothetical protein
LKPIASPAPSITMTVASRNSPNSVATLSRTASGSPFFVNASWRSAQTTTGATPASDTASTVMLRRRSGTKATQSSAPMAATTMAARE